MALAVRFDRYGGSDVLEVVEVDEPRPGAGEVVVRVVAAATNPGEIKIREGAFAGVWPATFPEGQGNDEQADDPVVWQELAELVASGQLTIPIQAIYPLERVREAYDELGARHTRGKIVLSLAPN